MIKEVKTIFLAALTLILYAASIFLREGGSLVFPFPLNPFIFFIVTVQFAVWNWQWKNFAIVTVATATFGVLASEVFWEIILSAENLEDFYSQPWIYWFYLLESIGFLAITAVQIKEQSKLLPRILTFIGGGLLGFGHVMGYEIFTLVGFLILMIAAYVNRASFPIHLLWTLLFFLDCTMWATYIFS